VIDLDVGLHGGRLSDALERLGGNLSSYQQPAPKPAPKAKPETKPLFGHVYASGVEQLVAAVCMTSASADIPSEALPYFKGKRVRIFMHDDKAGDVLAERIAQQLRWKAKKVDEYHFDGLVQTNGTPVQDLNDLCRIDYDCWEGNRQVVESLMDFATEGRN
jgi:hypothetical protein